MAKQPEKTEAERWRQIADQYRNEATRLGTAVIELEAEVQRLLSQLHAAKFGRTSRKQKDTTPPEA